VNILHTVEVGIMGGFNIIFEAVQPDHFPKMDLAEADAIVKNELVCFTPNISAMKNGHVVGIIQCETVIMKDYAEYYSTPEFKELANQVVDKAHIFIKDQCIKLKAVQPILKYLFLV